MKPCRVLVVHNAYRQQGGEDSVVASEAGLLAANGHAVELFTRANDEIEGMSRLALAWQTCWSRKSVRDFAELVEVFAPDVVHIHNTFPLISPSVVWAAARAAVPVVQTLHNFRLLCPQAMFLRRGKECEDCLGHLPWPGVVHACYHDSTAQSAVIAGMLIVHRAIGTYRNKVSRFIALNEFCRRKFVAGGLPAERVVVKPNFVDLPAPVEAPRDGFLFVGRLSLEKGVAVLVSAARQTSGAPVRVAGTGPDASRLEGAPGIEALGALPGPAVVAEMTRAIALLLPSLWYENFPRTLVEAFACGLPAIASRIGALAELVEDGVTGLLFQPADAKDLASKMRWAQQHPEQMAIMGRRARRLYEAEFSAARNYQRLQAIYGDAIEDARRAV